MLVDVDNETMTVMVESNKGVYSTQNQTDEYDDYDYDYTKILPGVAV